MDVYVLLEVSPYDSTLVINVFRNREDAEEFGESQHSFPCDWIKTKIGDYQTRLSIEEHELL